MNLTPQSQQIGRDDQSWLGSAHGTNSAQSIALAVAAFTAGTHYPNGYLPSGLPIGLYTSGGNSGKFGPYTTGASDGSQTLAGFLLTPVAIPAAGAPAVVNGALLDRGRVITSKVPIIAIDTAAKTSNPRFNYV
jgi:hypothetical protein